MLGKRQKEENSPLRIKAPFITAREEFKENLAVIVELFLVAWKILYS